MTEDSKLPENVSPGGPGAGLKGRLVLAAILGGALIASTAILGNSLVRVFRIKHSEQRVTVTGSATKRIHSDLVVWRVAIRAQATEMAPAYRKLSSDVPAVVAFIKARGIDEKEIKVSAATIDEVHPHDKEGHLLPETTIAYQAAQTIEVSGGDIEKVERLSREATELIDKGIYVRSEAPLYIYTKLAELKIQMLAEASKDARHRADQMAQNLGSHVSGLITARMGVLQINAAHSTEVSGEGNNDKTALDKDVLAVVSASFSIDP
jgi:uncharacterized protein